MPENNYFVGVDVGATYCKAVAINANDNKIISKALTLVSGAPEKASEECLKILSKDLNSKIKNIKKKTVATGQNGDKISISNKISEITCIGKGAHNLNPEIAIIADVGSFSVKAIKIDKSGKIIDYMMNNKCAGGSGVLLELVAEGLELKVDELSDIAFKSTRPIMISSQCSIFAESEVISYKNEGADLSDLVAGVCNSISGRVYPMIRKLDKNPQKLVMTGGVALNKKVVHNLEERLNLKMLELPIDPMYMAAYGAAILAKNSGGK